jgi:aryl-alcohol dehydrogenase-like predicted oxidoreductase
MQYRKFGRTGWQVSEVGYGMWGLADWSGADERENDCSLDLAVEQMLGRLLKRHPGKQLYVATKIPPRNFTWPSRREFTLDNCFPPEHIIDYTEKSLKNLGLDTIDLQQFHVWEDAWAQDERWQRTMEQLKQQGKIRATGISVNRWEPNNGLEAIRTGLIDAVQVIYNIFDQAPEDALFPLCDQMDIGVIARVPFDEGTLTGNLTKDTQFPENDWRSTYFVPENLHASVEHADRLKPLVPSGMTMAEMALRFILSHPSVSTTIPGMRKEGHVQANTAAGDGQGLPTEMLSALKSHRWDREPTEWSQ